MGGIGSGAVGHRPVAEKLKKIDVREMKRDGLFSSPYTGETITWSDGFRVSILVGMEGFTLSFGDMEQEVALTFMPLHFGGKRVFCLCPACSSQCAILYFYKNRFCCSGCCNVTWQSCNDWVHDRNIKKERKIRAKLGGSPSLLEPIRGKPFNMHHKTFYRLVRELANVGETVSPTVIKEIDKFIGEELLQSTN